jgi:hypothetical protein
MTATVFPAYGLARMVVPKWYALAAAGASVAVPALAYAPFIVEEPLAYPISTLALWLVARSLELPSRGRLAAALGACVLAVLTRTQLAILFVVLALGLLWLAWQSEVARRWRAQWTGWDWVGAVTLALGVAFALMAAIGHASTAWRNTMLLYKDRIFEHASWALGALAIGVGVLPVLLAPRSETRGRAPSSRRASPRSSSSSCTPGSRAPTTRRSSRRSSSSATSSTSVRSCSPRPRSPSREESDAAGLSPARPS